MVWKRNRLPASLLPLVMLLGNCGIYSFRGSLPPHIDSIVISDIINQTSEFVLTVLVAELVNELFVRENILKVTDPASATSDLKITITRVTDTPSTFTIGETVQEWQLRVNTKVVWYDLARNKPLFERSFSSLGHYSPGGDIGSDQIDNDGDGAIDEDDEFGDPREAALRRVIVKISEDILNTIVSTW